MSCEKNVKSESASDIWKSENRGRYNKYQRELYRLSGGKKKEYATSGSYKNQTGISWKDMTAEQTRLERNRIAREYRRNHREKCLESQRRCRAKKRAVNSGIST